MREETLEKETNWWIGLTSNSSEDVRADRISNRLAGDVDCNGRADRHSKRVVANHGRIGNPINADTEEKKRESQEQSKSKKGREFRKNKHSHDKAKCLPFKIKQGVIINIIKRCLRAKCKVATTRPSSLPWNDYQPFVGKNKAERQRKEKEQKHGTKQKSRGTNEWERGKR